MATHSELEHNRMYGSRKHIDRDFTPSGNYPVGSIRTYDPQRHREATWPTIRTFPQANRTSNHTDSVERELGPKIRAPAPVAKAVDLEREMGAKRGVTNARNGIPCRRGGDKAYGTVEYSPGFYQQPSLPSRVPVFDKTMNMTSSLHPSSALATAVISAPNRNWVEEEKERQKQEELEKARKEVEELNKWAFDEKRKEESKKLKEAAKKDETEGKERVQSATKKGKKAKAK
ncbi:hypothetical protein BLNAU_20883 [Blattamonas nauphoetae]|uniref:Uncharacterized protein n=1 Tax=Blattamonas nauphoetae TaxID=2049346 RepID=A0ABQ9WYL5_9EUKA|nr:hypothetical protein BLNAU_20883 [Blattamonas nauphoetae]